MPGRCTKKHKPKVSYSHLILDPIQQTVEYTPIGSADSASHIPPPGVTNMTATIKAFAAQSNTPAALIRAVVRQVGGWASFREMAADVANHGADAGFSGFCYHTDTVAFTKRQKAAILGMAKEQAADLGSDSCYSMIAGFRCLNGINPEEVVLAVYHAHHSERTAVFNALAWYALEEVARSYVDFCDR